MPSMGEIVAHLGLNDSKFKAGVNNVGKWSKSKFAAIGTAAAGAFAATFSIQKFTESLNFTASIQELAEQTSLTTEEFQRLSYQLRQVGGNQQDVVRGVNTLDRMMAKAREGNEAAIKDFDRLGISIENVTDESRLDILKRMAVVFNNLDDKSRGGALDALRRLLGDDSARRFVAAFKEDFVGGLASAKVISDEVIANAKALTGELQNLNDTVMKELAKILSDNSEEIVKIIQLTGMAVEQIGNLVNLMKFFKNPMNIVTLPIAEARNLMISNAMAQAIPSRQVNQKSEEYLKEMRDTLKTMQSQPAVYGLSGFLMGE